MLPDDVGSHLKNRTVPWAFYVTSSTNRYSFSYFSSTCCKPLRRYSIYSLRISDSHIGIRYHLIFQYLLCGHSIRFVPYDLNKNGDIMLFLIPHINALSRKDFHWWNLKYMWDVFKKYLMILVKTHSMSLQEHSERSSENKQNCHS